MRNLLDKIVDYAKDYALENTGLKLLALLITAVIWLSVALRPMSEITITNVPIEFRNLPEFLIVSEYDALTARVSLRGSRDALEAVRPSALVAVADLSGIKPGVRVIRLELDRSKLPPGVKDLELEPQNVRILVERLVERDLPVRPRFEGEPPQGYELIGWNVSPPIIRVAGAESRLQSLKEASTETINLTDKTAPFVTEVAVDIGTPNVNIPDERQRKVQLTVQVSEKRKERILEGVPVRLNGAPAGARPSPQSVRVRLFGPPSALQAITLTDLIASVEYQKGRNEFAPKVILSRDSDRIEIKSVEPKTIRVILR
jgi:YbbR domain-containing protein